MSILGPLLDDIAKFEPTGNVTSGNEELAAKTTDEEDSTQSELVTFGEPYKVNYPFCPVFLDIDDQGKKNYSIYLHGCIHNVGRYRDVLNCLYTAKPEDTIRTYIDSPGGDLITGAALASALEVTQAQTINEATGMCASAGSLYYSAGKTYEIGDLGVLMYHMSGHMDWGSSARIAEAASRMIRYVNKKCLSKALAAGHLTEDEVDKITNRHGEVWIGPEEARKRIAAKNQSVGVESLDFKFSRALETIPPIYKLDTASDLYQEIGIAFENFNVSDEPYRADDLRNMKVGEAHKIMLLQNMTAGARMGGDEKRQNTNDFSAIKFGNTYQIMADYNKNWWCPKFQTAWARTLDKRTEEEVVEIIIPGGIGSWAFLSMGPIFAAIDRCKATVITRISGPAEITDAAMASYGDKMIIDPYGQIYISSEILDYDYCMDYRGEYVKSIMGRMLKSGLITEEQFGEWFDKKKSIEL